MNDQASPSGVQNVLLEFPQERVVVSVLVKPLGDDQYELLEHPFLIDEPQYGDVISAVELGPNKLRLTSVIRRSGLIREDYCLSDEIFESRVFQQILHKVMSSGGFWQRDLACILWVFFKPNTYDPRDEIDAEMRLHRCD